VEAALLEWAINLMADVVENERLNKMNARNIAMVFAPNMTKVTGKHIWWSLPTNIRNSESNHRTLVSFRWRTP
jgi:hypothetical protein